MKCHHLCALLLCVFLLSGCDKGTAVKEAPVSEATETESSSNASESSDFFVIDVRSQKEWDEGHLESATLIPHTEIVEGIKKVTDDKDAKIYLF